jgi:hypothetical protein
MRQFPSGQLDSTQVYTAVQYYPDTRTPSKFSTGTRFSTCTHSAKLVLEYLGTQCCTKYVVELL